MRSVGQTPHPGAAQPRVSIIIPCNREVGRLRDCLASIRRDGCRTIEREVLVVLNGIEAELAGRDLLGVRIVRSAVNLGYGGGCNLGAAQARGGVLVFLNDDVQVHEGWLEALASALDEHSEAGIAGARVLHEDGSLQEAGSILWSDGSTLGVGGGLAAGSSEFAYRRPVDYCSGCALAIRRPVWEAIGGFDARFTPAYYEDVDLCLSARALGYSVLYEPAAVVTHHENASLDGAVVSFLFAEKKRLLVEKWATALIDQEPNDGSTEAAVHRAIQRARGWPTHVLVLDDRLPDTSHSSGAGRMLTTVSELCAAGYTVSLLALDRELGDTSELGRLGVEVVRQGLRSHLARPEITYEVIIISRPDSFERSIELVRELQPQATVVYDAAAILHRGIDRRLDLLGDEAALRGQANATRAIEQRLGTEVDAIVCPSEEDAELFRVFGARCPVRVVPPFNRRLRVTPAGFEERRDLLYCATWLDGADSADGDGLRWFVDRVLPLIETEIPWVRVTVSGADPPNELTRLERPTLRFARGVEDLHRLYESARAVIVPIRFGAGVRLEAADAIAHGVPLIATSAGLEGVPLHGRSTAVDRFDEPDGFARAAIALLTDRELWQARRAALHALRGDWEAQEAAPWAGMLARLLAAKAAAEVVRA